MLSCRTRIATSARRANTLSFATASQNNHEAYEKVLNERTERTTSLQERSWTLESIQGKYNRGDINLFPNYQRGFKWKSPEASRLVLTVLEERFVPAIVVHQKADNRYDVVDGKQRLSSLLSFYYGLEAQENKLPNAASMLQSLGEDDEELNGLTYEMLSDARKRQFNDYSLDVKIIPKQTDDNTVYAVYEDINSGGSKLSPHQLRRAAFYGPYIELIDELVKDENFRSILGTDFDESNDGEMILRAFAVCRRSSDFKLPWKRFMNKELIAVRDMNDSDQERYLAKRRSDFEFAMRQARDIFGTIAFRKFDEKRGEWSKKVDTAVLWSSLYSAIVKGRQLNLWSDTSLIQNADKFQEALILAYKNPDFSSLFSAGKVSAKTLHTRLTVLENIIKTIAKGSSIKDDDISGLIDDKGPRSFDRRIIPMLFDRQDGKCSVCNQVMDKERLRDGTYVQIDHIRPYAKGGETKHNNAALVHAKCNQSKGVRSTIGNSM